MNNHKVLEIIEFTDPVCTWCWGSEPLLRKLETRYGDQIQIKYIMGGLVKDIREFYDSANNIGGDPEQANNQIVKHWIEASERHGMPVQSQGFRLFSQEYPSTYPQNIAYKAAQMEDQVLADKFLRRLREASAAEARQTNKPEVLIELASEVGLDIGNFLGRISNGSAEAAFNEDLMITRQYGVRGFPTFMVRYGDKEIVLRSYQNFASFQTVILSLNPDIREQVPEATEEEVAKFISKYGRVAPVEIETSFDLSNLAAQEIIAQLVAKNQCKRLTVGNGEFIEMMSNPMACDTITGTCNI